MRVRRGVVAVGVLLALLVVPGSASALSWSRPQLIDPGSTAVSSPFGDVTSIGGVYVNPGTALTGMSCPSLSLCVAVDQQGNVLHSVQPVAAHATWTRVRPTVEPLHGVSCPSRTFCAAVGAESDFTPVVLISIDPTGGASDWSSRPIAGLSNVDQFTGISCPTTSFCVATTAFGKTVTANEPLRPTARWRVTPGLSGTAVSCPSSRLCVTIDSTGVTTSRHPGPIAREWTRARLSSLNYGTPAAISCTALRLCVAGDDQGNVIFSRDPTGGSGRWRSVNVDARGALSCANCYASPTGLTGVSCSSGTFCTAVDGAGNALETTKSWTRRPLSSWRTTSVGGPIGSPNWLPFSGVACHSSVFCIAFDEDGDVAVGTPRPITRRPLPACDRHAAPGTLAGPDALIYGVSSSIRGSFYFGCERPNGSSYSLGQTPPETPSYGFGLQTGDFVAAGPFVASQSLRDADEFAQCAKYDLTGCPLPPHWITVIDTSAGRKVYLNTDPTAGYLALSASGAVAWIQGGDGGTPTTLLATALHPAGASGFTTSTQQLDSGAIDPNSLRFSGLTLYWTKAGQAESATLG